MAEYALIARDLGVRIIGGCCGTKPEHLAAMRAALESTPKSAPPSKQEITNRLGVAWKDLAEKPATDAKAGRERRRRRGDRGRSKVENMAEQ